jgi:hypothetical protein
MAPMARHPNMPHVLYTSTQNRNTLMLHFKCETCGDTTEWRCEGAPGMPVYRLNCYANDHRHGYPPIRNPKPY